MHEHQRLRTPGFPPTCPRGWSVDRRISVLEKERQVTALGLMGSQLPGAEAIVILSACQTDAKPLSHCQIEDIHVCVTQSGSWVQARLSGQNPTRRPCSIPTTPYCHLCRAEIQELVLYALIDRSPRNPSFTDNTYVEIVVCRVRSYPHCFTTFTRSNFFFLPEAEPNAL